MAQVNVYVVRTERERFAEYAAEFGLDVTALSNLLLLRELRVARLGGMIGEISRTAGPRDAKITAHLSTDRRTAFAARAKSLGLSLSEAGGVLVLAELKERWLEKSVDNF